MRQTRALKRILFDQFMRGVHSFLAQRESLAKFLGELETRWGMEAVSAALGDASIKKLRSRKPRRPTPLKSQKNPKARLAAKGKKMSFKQAASLVLKSIRHLGKDGATFTSRSVAVDLHLHGRAITNNWVSIILSKMIWGIGVVNRSRKPFDYKITGRLVLKKYLWARTKTPKRKKKA